MNTDTETGRTIPLWRRPLLWAVVLFAALWVAGLGLLACRPLTEGQREDRDT